MYHIWSANLKKKSFEKQVCLLLSKMIFRLILNFELQKRVQAIQTMITCVIYLQNKSKYTLLEG